MLRSETAAEPARLTRALTGLRAYQEAPRPARPPAMPIVAEARGAVLRDYGGAGLPVLFVPSLINPPDVLDLSADQSLLRWLTGQGARVLMLDWGSDVAARAGLTLAGHVEQVIVPLLGALETPPALVGYCLGGTLAFAAAALAPVRGVATIAAPWHFAGYSAQSRAVMQRMWAAAAPATAALGVLPMEALQSLFWSLDPARTVAKFEAFADLPPGSAEADRFVTLEDWANDGPPIVAAAARELFEGLIAADATGEGRWQVGGRVIDPAALAVPLLTIASTTDRIVPHASAPRAGERIDLALGHVGMVVGRRAPEALWAPLAAWLSRLPAA